MLSQLDGASLPWLILELLGLWSWRKPFDGRSSSGRCPFPPDSRQAIRRSAEWPQDIGIGFAALWSSAAPVFYGLAAYLLWETTGPRVADVHLARDVAKTRGALALGPGEISDSSRITLVTAPDWSPGGPVTIRVRNDDQRADLAVVTAECAFYLGNEQESHREPFSFELRPPLPAGFGTLVNARTKPTLQYENSDYQHRVDCHVTSALLRTPRDYPEVRIVSVRDDSDCRFGTSSGTGCLRFAIENLAGRAIDDIEISCIAGYELNDVSWKEFSNFRREFARKDQPLVPATTTQR